MISHSCKFHFKKRIYLHKLQLPFLCSWHSTVNQRLEEFLFGFRDREGRPGSDDAVVRQGASAMLIKCAYLAVITQGQSHSLGGQTRLSKNRNHRGGAMASFDGTNHSPHEESREGDWGLTEPLINFRGPWAKFQTPYASKMLTQKKWSTTSSPWSHHVTAK